MHTRAHEHMNAHTYANTHFHTVTKMKCDKFFSKLYSFTYYVCSVCGGGDTHVPHSVHLKSKGQPESVLCFDDVGLQSELRLSDLVAGSFTH